MSKFIVTGGKKLSGTVRVQGSKNASFALLAASLLTDEECVLENIPDIADVRSFIKIMQFLGAEVEFSDHTARVKAGNLKNKPIPAELMGLLRGSILFAGALLGRFGDAVIAYPGGDAIGRRPIDVHLDGFRKLGAEVKEGPEYLEVRAKKLTGEKIILPLPTVTGTENLILASVLAKGSSEIRLAATEPHVQDLANFLNQMGAKIENVGTPFLKITGVQKLSGTSFRAGFDEIVAVTLAIAAAVTQSEVKIENPPLQNLDAPLAILERTKVNLTIDNGTISIHPPIEKYQATRIVTGVFPQLLTDFQPLFGVLATQSHGETSIHDWIYEGRQEYLRILARMGAEVEFADLHRAKVFGPTPLIGGEIKTPDIRAGASILIAALIASGESVIYNAEIIDRGYERLDDVLNGLGADVKRVE